VALPARPSHCRREKFTGLFIFWPYLPDSACDLICEKWRASAAISSSLNPLIRRFMMVVLGGGVSDLKAMSCPARMLSGRPAIEGMPPGERPSVPWQLAQAPASTVMSKVDCADAAGKTANPATRAAAMAVARSV